MGFVFRLLCLGVLVLAAGKPPSTPRAAASPLVLQTGDVLLQTSRSSRSLLIQRASRSKYSHVGLVEVTPHGIYVVEAIAPVSRTPLAAWAARGVGRAVTVLRPKGLDAATRGRVLAEASRHLGKPYDARYRWDDETLYCSELVVKAFERGAGVVVGRQQRVAELALAPPERALVKRLGGNDSQILVTPGSLDGDEHFELLARDLRWP
jgi:uncharacterized protein YycO